MDLEIIDVMDVGDFRSQGAEMMPGAMGVPFDELELAINGLVKRLR